jgi:hypothetical protein
LAFGAYDEYGLENLKIVPVGVNYAAGKEFRSDVAIKIGEPLQLKDYLALYKIDSHDAFRKVTEDLYQRMLPLVIHLESTEDEHLANRLFTLYCDVEKPASWPILDYTSERFAREKQLANQLNHCTAEQKSTLSTYLSKDFDRMPIRFYWQKILVLIATFPVFILGFTINAIPFYLAKRIAFKKVTQAEFLTPVRLGLMMVFFILWFIIWLVIFTFLFGWYALIAIFILPLSGYLALLWKKGFDSVTRRKILPQGYLTRINELLV